MEAGMVIAGPQQAKRFSLRCLFRRHTYASFTLRAKGERWGTIIRYCARCGRVDDLRAEKR